MLNIFFQNLIIKNDVPEPWTLSFQDGVSPGFYGIVDLHDNIFFYLVVIAILVFWMLGSILFYFNSYKSRITYKYLVHGTLIEVLWTIFPAVVLLAIAIPSFRLLYILDEVTLPTITVKATGLHKDSLLFENLFIYSIVSSTQWQTHKHSLCASEWENNKKRLNNYYTIRHFHTVIRAINRIGPHNEDIISVIFGLLLGDGYASNRTGEGVRIAVKQSIIDKEYLYQLYEFFQQRGYCTNNPPRMYARYIKGRDKIYYGYEFNTFTFRSFLWIYKIFYNKGKKCLTLSNQFEKYFTPLSLAIWICDDGSWTGNGVRIAANNFSLKEIQMLIKILNNKFLLDCTIQIIHTNKDKLNPKYSIYIKKNSISNLRSLLLKLSLFQNVLLYKKLGIINKN